MRPVWTKYSAGLLLLFGVAIGSGALAAPLDYRELLARPRPAATARIQYGPGPYQFGDIWMPAGGGPHRVVVLIHGGCWLAHLPGLELMDHAADDLRAHGIAVWNVEYRRIGYPGGGYPGSFEDIANAVDYLRVLAKTYRLDLADVVVAGHSAGGHFALWTAARARVPKSSPLYSDNPMRVQRAVSIAGIGDLAAFHDRGRGACGEPRTIDILVGAARRGPFDVYTDTSPANLLPIGRPQTMIAGAADPIVPQAFALDYAAKAVKAGDVVLTVTIPDAGHFELIDPKNNAFEQVRAAIAGRP